MLETLCSGCSDRFKQEKCPHCDQVLCLNCIEEHNSNLLENSKTDLKTLKRTINDMNPDADTNTEIDNSLNKICQKRMNVLRIKITEQAEFKEKQKLEKIALDEKQKLEEIDFMNTLHQQQHDLLVDLDNSQKKKIQQLMEYDKRGKENVKLWKEEIESLSKKLKRDNLTTRKLLKVTTTVAKLSSEIMEFNTSMLDYSDCVVEQACVSLNTELELSSTLTYYRSINKPIRARAEIDRFGAGNDAVDRPYTGEVL